MTFGTTQVQVRCKEVSIIDMWKVTVVTTQLWLLYTPLQKIASLHTMMVNLYVNY